MRTQYFNPTKRSYFVYCDTVKTLNLVPTCCGLYKTTNELNWYLLQLSYLNCLIFIYFKTVVCKASTFERQNHDITTGILEILPVTLLAENFCAAIYYVQQQTNQFTGWTTLFCTEVSPQILLAWRSFLADRVSVGHAKERFSKIQDGFSAVDPLASLRQEKKAVFIISRSNFL